MAAIVRRWDHRSQRNRSSLFAYPRLCRQDLSEASLAKYCAGYSVPIVFDDFLDAGCICWSIEERFVIVQAMFYVARATGELSARRNQTLLKAQQVFEMTEAEFQQTVERVLAWN